jgi:microcin C transport system ATP-binding protein
MAENNDAPLLSVRDLSVAFNQGPRETLAVDRISFDIKKGETVAIVGESGSGKSVTALSVMKLLPYPTAHHPSGKISFKGQELLHLPEHEIRRVRGNDITIIFQEPMTSLNPLHTIEQQVGEILELHQGLSGQAARARTIELLAQVGIPDPAGRLASYPHEFSGGQRQRIAVARAIVLEPTFVVLDEPTSALDMLIQAQIVDLLRDIQKRRELTYLFISHDLKVVAALASRLVVMKDGKVVETGAATDLFKNPQSPYTRALFAAAFKLETAAEGVVAQ